MNKKSVIILGITLLCSLIILILSMNIGKTEKVNKGDNSQENIVNNNNNNNNGTENSNKNEFNFDKTISRENGLYGILNGKMFKLEKIQSEYSFEITKAEEGISMFNKLWSEIKPEPITITGNDVLNLELIYIINNDIVKFSVDKIYFADEKGTNGFYTVSMYIKKSDIENGYIYILSSSNQVKEVNILKIRVNNGVEYFGIKIINS